MTNIKVYPIFIFAAMMLIVSVNQVLALDEFVPIDLEPYSNTKLVGHVCGH